MAPFNKSDEAKDPLLILRIQPNICISSWLMVLVKRIDDPFDPKIVPLKKRDKGTGHLMALFKKSDEATDPLLILHSQRINYFFTYYMVGFHQSHGGMINPRAPGGILNLRAPFKNSD
jgi:hypothetical protein